MRALLGARRIGAALALALGTALFAAPSPAFADWDSTSCYVGLISCVTRPIPAHRSQHWVRINVSWPAHYEVKDLDTNVVVGRGHEGSGGWKTIYGLYGERYQLKVYGRYHHGTIANCTSGCKNP